MRFHLPSFALGVVVGAGSVVVAPHLRPIAVELAATGYRMVDAAMLRVARGRENLQDLLAEARALARVKLGKHALRSVGASA
jgi:hypothetical protein